MRSSSSATVRSTASRSAQRDLEMEHLLSVADEAEGPRLDDPCMNRADIDLVQRRSVHRVEGVVVHRAAAVVAVGRKAQRLGPRHAVEADAVALGDVAFEGVQGGVYGRQRGQGLLVVILHGVRGDQYAVFRVVEQDADEAHPVAGRESEVVGHVVARVGKPVGEVVVEVGVGRFGNLRERNGGGGVVGYVRIHGFHSEAISAIRRSRAPGCQTPTTMAASSSVRADHESVRSTFEGCSSSWLGW